MDTYKYIHTNISVYICVYITQNHKNILINMIYILIPNVIFIIYTAYFVYHK